MRWVDSVKETTGVSPQELSRTAEDGVDTTRAQGHREPLKLTQHHITHRMLVSTQRHSAVYKACPRAFTF